MKAVEPVCIHNIGISANSLARHMSDVSATRGQAPLHTHFITGQTGQVHTQIHG